MRAPVFCFVLVLFVTGISLEVEIAFGQKIPQTVSLTTKEKKNFEIPCENRNLFAVWDKIKNEFSYNTFEDLNDSGIKNCTDLFRVEKIIDLNGDRRAEMVVHQIADCPASGNCTFWIFQKVKSGYKAVLDTNMIQSFKPLRTKTNGYLDLELRTWNTGLEYYIQLFKFASGKYKARKCWFETHQINGRLLKKPKITFVKCGEYDYVNDNLLKNSQIKTKQPEFVKFKLKDLPCEDETLRLVWNGLTDETASINVERAEKIKNCLDIIEVWIDDEPIDLDNDGNQEIVIRGIENPYSRCGNNCYTYWIFQQTTEKNYRKLFEAEGYLPIVKSKKTKGYKDIVFEVFANYNESGNILFQFNGTEYVPKQCWSASNLYKNKDGEIVEGKKVEIKYYKCDESGYITNFRHQI